MLFYNAWQHPLTGTYSHYGDISDIFYLMMVPWFRLYDRKIESFRREGKRTTIELEGN